MQLKWPLVLLLVVPVVALFVWRLRRPAKHQKRLVAESASALHLPSYAKVKRRARLLALAESAVTCLIMAALVVIAARPQTTIQKVDHNKSRDIVMCMDASSSMTAYIPDALAAMTKIVEANPTDRYGLVLFQNAPYVALPLTSDVTAIKLKTTDLIAQFKDRFASAAYLAGFNPDMTGGTDIGAGLAGCVRRFDNLTEPHARHIVMLSDMDNNGTTNQATVAELLPKYGIRLHVMAPDVFTQTDPKDSPVVRITGARVYNLEDASGTQNLIGQILRSILSEQKTVQYVAVDAPYLWWLVVAVLSTAWTVILLLRWRWRT